MFWQKEEEVINVFSHFFAFMVSIVASVIFWYKAFKLDLNDWQILIMALYPSMILLLFISSVLYHFMDDRIFKKYCRNLDQTLCMLFLPVCQAVFVEFFLKDINNLNSARILVEVNMVIMIIVSIVLFFTHYETKWGFYLAATAALVCGWSTLYICYLLKLEGLAVIAMQLIYGGIAFAIGSVFYLFDLRIRYMHAFWHLFSMIGIGIHFFSVISNLK